MSGRIQRPLAGENLPFVVIAIRKKVWIPLAPRLSMAYIATDPLSVRVPKRDAYPHRPDITMRLSEHCRDVSIYVHPIVCAAKVRPGERRLRLAASLKRLHKEHCWTKLTGN